MLYKLPNSNLISTGLILLAPTVFICDMKKKTVFRIDIQFSVLMTHRYISKRLAEIGKT